MKIGGGREQEKEVKAIKRERKRQINKVEQLTI